MCHKLSPAASVTLNLRHDHCEPVSHVASVMTRAQLSGHSGQPGLESRAHTHGETQAQVARSAHARLFTHMAAASITKIPSGRTFIMPAEESMYTC